MSPITGADACPATTATVQRWIDQRRAGIDRSPHLDNDGVKQLVAAGRKIRQQYPDSPALAASAFEMAYRLLTEDPGRVIEGYRHGLASIRSDEALLVAALRQAAVTLLEPATPGGRAADGLGGQTVFSVASGVDRSTVHRWAKEAGLTSSRPPRKRKRSK